MTVNAFGRKRRSAPYGNNGNDNGNDNGNCHRAGKPSPYDNNENGDDNGNDDTRLGAMCIAPQDKILVNQPNQRNPRSKKMKTNIE